MEPTIYLRIFVEVDTKDAATEIAKKITSTISQFVETKIQTIDKYWKIKEYYEIFFKLYPKNQIKADFEKISSAIGSGWESSGDLESIWNFGEDKAFLSDSVKWAHLEGEYF